MEYKRFNDKLVMRLDPGDEICESIMTASKAEGIRLASVSGMGAVGRDDRGRIRPFKKGIL